MSSPFRLFKTLVYTTLLSLLTACSSEKFLGEDDLLLTSVKLTSDNPETDVNDYLIHLRQTPNSKWFNLFKVPQGLYNLSGTDTTKAINRFWRRVGEPPVIYSPQQTANTQNSLALALKDKGYLSARVSATTTQKKNSRKIKLHYTLRPGQPYIITKINTTADNPIIDSLINISKSQSLLTPGMKCDISLLDKERSRITTMLHNHGFYNVLKNFMRYEIDTLSGPSNVKLSLIFEGKAIAPDTTDIYTQYRLRNINLSVLNSDNETTNKVSVKDSSLNITYTNTNHKTFRPNMLVAKTYLKPNQIYRQQDIAKTYRSLSNLEAIAYASIQTEKNDSAQLDADIQVVPNKINTLGVELEGTNTAGNLGVASSLTYTNRNLFNGSEVWTVSLKGAYEAITGLEGYGDQNYIELGLETKLSFPKLILPFCSSFNDRATSNLSLQYDTQERPEFHRRVLTTLWSYRWSNPTGTFKHRLDIPSLNYVYMPWISKTFREEYLQSDNYHSALIRYAYEDLLILNFTYSQTYSPSAHNDLQNSPNKPGKNNSGSYQINWSIESAGNIIYALSKPMGLTRNKDNQYTLFDVAYAQYVKFDFDFSRHFTINPRNTIATHFSFGIAQPYGNATIVPYEKRYFAGGANSVRGWGVRELGPGRYVGQDGKIDFINQTGNLKLLANIELRTKLLWKFSGAFFIDAGNIWTTRLYEVTGSGGRFDVSTFWKQIAASYGIGLRMNLDYFILRFDMAMKAINPAYQPSDKRYLPLLRPKLSRDFAFHFAVGLPF